MIDPTPLWDFDDPAGSEQRFRAAADGSTGEDRDVLLTQVARALGLQERYDEGHAVLDALEATGSPGPGPATLVALERGRRKEATRCARGSAARSSIDPRPVRVALDAHARWSSCVRPL